MSGQALSFQVGDPVEVRLLDIWVDGEVVGTDPTACLVRWSAGHGHERLGWYEHPDVKHTAPRVPAQDRLVGASRSR